MKSSAAGAAKRAYRMTARAQSVDDTKRRILRATMALHEERFADEVTLEAVAERADVTVQTVLRHFASKAGLLQALAGQVESEVREQRWQAPVADVAGAVDNLMDHYEGRGEMVLRLLAQEERVPEFKPLMDRGRAAHREWVERSFSPLVAGAGDADALLTQVRVITDVYVWKLLRLDQRRSRSETQQLVIAMIDAVLNRGSSP